jgi:hypothetical protein
MCFILSVHVIYCTKRKAAIPSHVQCMNIHITFTVVTWSTSLLFVCMWCWTPLSYLCSIVIFWSAHGTSSVDSLNNCDSETIFVLFCFVLFWTLSLFWGTFHIHDPLVGKGVHDCSQWSGLNLCTISLWGNRCSTPWYVWSVCARLGSKGPF